MKATGNCTYDEMGRVANATLRKKTTRESEYLSFIRYCAERLDRGDSVQAIWHDYQALKQKISD